MMFTRRVLALLAVAGAICIWANTAAAATNYYHRPGNLICLRCHTLHASRHGAITGAGQQAPDLPGADPHTAHEMLLIFPNISDTCLSCHDSAGAQATFTFDMGAPIGVITAPKVYYSDATAHPELPAGNFYYSDVNAYHGHGPGDSASYWLNGANYESNAPTITGLDGLARTDLNCTSCHDPHGDDTVLNRYRNLNSHVGPGNLDVTNTFTSGDGNGGSEADQAQLVSGNGANANFAQGDGNHNVYREGTPGNLNNSAGAFCAACHTNFHGTNGNNVNIYDGTDWIRHPTDAKLADSAPDTYDYSTNYGNSSGTLGDSDYRYPLVTIAAATTAAPWVVTGDGGSNRVFCLSCHQAHASKYAKSLRWDPTISSQVDGSGYDGCGKCHAR